MIFVRTAGTFMADWLARARLLHLVLTASTLLTGVAFVVLLIVWHSAKTPRPLSAKSQ